MATGMMVQNAVIALGLLAFISFILGLVAAHVRAKIRHRTEVQKELIAKFTSAEELGAFLNSDAGKLLISGTREEPKWPARPVDEQIGVAIGWGVIVLSVGVAVLYVSGLTLPGAVISALGGAMLFNALLRLGWYAFAKKRAA
jgi:hypothetical protein